MKHHATSFLVSTYSKEFPDPTHDFEPLEEHLAPQRYVSFVTRSKRKLLDPKRKTRMKIMAKQFGVSEMQLYRIKSGENWGHITID